MAVGVDEDVLHLPDVGHLKHKYSAWNAEDNIHQTDYDKGFRELYCPLAIRYLRSHSMAEGLPD